MATIKRKKVSGKATQGQKKNGLLHNKKFWIISSIISALVIACAIAIPLIIMNMSSKEEKVDYIAQEYECHGEKITFKKMNYEGVLMHSRDDYDDGTYYKHIFFAVFDFTTFYPDKSIDNGKADEDKLYNSVHDDALQALVEIQYYINQYNKSILNDDDDTNDSEVAILYLIDLSSGNNKNALTSNEFGNLGAEEFAFGYIAGVDGYQGSYEYEYDSNGKGKSWNINFTDFATLRTDYGHVTDFMEKDENRDPFQIKLTK